MVLGQCAPTLIAVYVAAAVAGRLRDATMAPWAAVLLVLTMNDAVQRTCSFNLETRLPIVKRGKKDSYFGYSVAGHQSFDELIGEVEDSW